MDSLVYGYQILDAFEKERESMWSNVERDTDYTHSITGIIEDNIRERLGF